MTLKAIIPHGQAELTVNGLHQWDYGQKLEIHSAELPDVVEVHFACAGMKEAVVRVCETVNGVATAVIPDRCLEQTTPITAWVYVIDETAGFTAKTITLPIIPRTKPQPGESVPEEYVDKYAEALAAMNGVGAKLRAEADEAVSIANAATTQAVKTVNNAAIQAENTVINKATQAVNTVNTAASAAVNTVNTAASEAAESFRTGDVVAKEALTAGAVKATSKTVTLNWNGEYAQGDVELDANSTYLATTSDGSGGYLTFVLHIIENKYAHASCAEYNDFYPLYYDHATKKMYYRHYHFLDDGIREVGYVNHGLSTQPITYTKITNITQEVSE